MSVCSVLAGFTCPISAFQFLNNIITCIAVARAAIQMVTSAHATSVAETAGSVQVCAEITGVAGLLECAVTNAATLTGSTKAGSCVIKSYSLLSPFHYLP